LRDTAKVEGLTFHDSRGAAATKLSKKLDPLELAKMLGHSDLSMLIRVYYRESAESIAQKLD
jgi:integrase